MGLTRKEATNELLQLKQDVELFKKNVKGRATLLRSIKQSIEFISRHKTEDSLNVLMVKERKSEFDIISKLYEGK